MSDITLESLIQEHKDRIIQLKYKPSSQVRLGSGHYITITRNPIRDGWQQQKDS